MRYRLLVLLVALVISAAPGMSPSAQAQARLQVVASTTIIADVARQVAEGAADVASLMPFGADPHSYQPAPRDVVMLAEADVVLINGANFEEGLMETIQNAGDEMNVAVVSQCVEILPFGLIGDPAHDAAGETAGQAAEADQAHDAELSAAALCEAHHAEMDALHGTDEAEGEAQDSGTAEPLGMLYTLECGGHDHAGETAAEDAAHENEAGGCDPHVWFDPHNVMLWTMMIRDTLSALDPANAEVYAANAAAYLQTLDHLAHHGIPDLLAALPEAGRILVTDHDALGYYTTAYGFEVVGVVVPGGSPLAEASAGELAALIDTIQAEGVPAVFAGTTVNPDLAQRVAEEAGATFYTLYTGSLSDTDGPAASYVDLMLYNTRTLIEALGQ